MNIKTHELTVGVNIHGQRLNKPRSGTCRCKKTFGKKWLRGATFALAS